MDGGVGSELWSSAHAHHGVFTRRRALAAGLTRHEIEHSLSTGTWRSLHDGVYVHAATPVTWRGALLAACWAGGTRAVASHRSALSLYGLPGARQQVAEVTTPRWRRARHAGVVAHETRELPDRDITEVDGVPVTTVARSLIDAAAVLRTSTLDLAVDEALRRSLVELEELWVRVEELAKPGRRGIRMIRTIIVRRHPDHELTESVREHLLLAALARADLPAPIPQYEIQRPGGRFVARVDAAYPDHRLALEYDSYLHHGSRGKYVRDLARRNEVTAAGWRIVHFTSDDLRNGCTRVCTVLKALLAAAA